MTYPLSSHHTSATLIDDSKIPPAVPQQNSDSRLKDITPDIQSRHTAFTFTPSDKQSLKCPNGHEADDHCDTCSEPACSTASCEYDAMLCAEANCYRTEHDRGACTTSHPHPSEDA